MTETDLVYERRWQQRLLALQRYKEANGSCNVISKDPANKTLSRWVENQRMFYRKQKLAPYRVALLEELGFEWVRPHRSLTKISKQKVVTIPLDEPEGVSERQAQQQPCDNEPANMDQLIDANTEVQHGGFQCPNNAELQTTGDDMAVYSPIEAAIRTAFV
ncbi:hypothetical protein MPSEU_000733400 [Mayamaea pseudoterrestris]|nr:hypothetical protein MPSEU_000733400 [Mayamaea pseudoterrestris]